MLRKLLLAALVAYAAPSLATVTCGGAIRANDTSTASTTKTVQLASDAQAGDTIIVGILNRTDETTTLSTIADPVNGTWPGGMTRQGPTDAAATTLRSWVAAFTNSAALTGTGDRTITVTTSVGISTQLVAMWCRSDAGALTFDQIATVLNPGSNQTSWTSNTLTVSHSGVLVGVLMLPTGQGSTAPTAVGAGETLTTTTADAGAFRSNLFTEMLAGAGTYGFETTIASTSTGMYHVMSLLEPGAPSGGLLLRRRRN